MKDFLSKHKLAFTTSFFVFIIDQITKKIVRNNLLLGEKIEVVPGFFNIVYVQNKGIVFGLLNREGYHFYVFVFLSVVAIVFLLYLLKGPFGEKRIGRLGIGLILGGAVGNLFDKLTLGSVVDFLDFYVSSFHWPAFNIADSAITCGVFLLILTNLKKA